MKYRGVSTILVVGHDDVRNYFDSIAHEYSDQHGNPDKLLKYRVGILRKEALIRENDVVLELGCGTADHIIALARFYRRGVGIDFSPEMVKVSNNRILNMELQDKVVCQVDNALNLDSLKNDSFDKIICVGSLEHIPDKAAVIESALRVLKPGGRFVCLTVNGDYLWYTKIAPLLNYNTHHFSSDNFVVMKDIEAMLAKSHFIPEKMGYWSFVPQGDMPSGIGPIFRFMDIIGRLLKIGKLRGGIVFTVKKLPKKLAF